MQKVPGFPGLRHFHEASSITFAEGNNFRDILRQVLPCLTPLLSPDDPLLQLIRLLGEIRTLLSLSCYDADRLQRLTDTISQYSTTAHVSNNHLSL